MRDKDRIPKALNVLKLCWEMFPDLRLGQLIGDAMNMIDGPMPDLYFVEDKQLAEALWAFRVKHGDQDRPTEKKKPKKKRKKRKKPAARGPIMPFFPTEPIRPPETPFPPASPWEMPPTW